jgi:hypothetical protein
LVGSAIVFVLLGIGFSRIFSSGGDREMKFDFDGGPWFDGEKRLQFKSVVWASNSRSRCLLLASTSPARFSGSLLVWKDPDKMMNLIDARGGSGASDLPEIVSLFGKGGFVIREQGGGLVGFADPKKEWMLFVQSGGGSP